MTSPMIIFTAFRHTARLGTLFQILLFLPLTLATLSTSAFLSLSLLLTLHSIIHATMSLLFPSLVGSLPFLQVPLHPMFLLFIFNLYPHPCSPLQTASSLWGSVLRYTGPLFVFLEGLASLIAVQTLGRKARKMINEHDGEGYEVGLLVGAAATYVASAWWIILTYPSVATSPLSSTLLGASITALVFLTMIGFVLRRTNVIESSGLALYLAYNVWLCSDEHEVGEHCAPLLSNLLPHLQKLLNFITNTIPKPLLIALMYRLTVLHMASRVLPSIGADPWDDVGGVDSTWEGSRPVSFHLFFPGGSRLAAILLTYRQTILIAVYSHLLLLDHSSQVWWRWSNVIFTLGMWAVEITLSNEDSEISEKWKIE
ncbi:uncharacterized protein EI90DRAFT_3146238 [Cantharellus anzutake]|uniref:uncharacterized protein n=1 Tax=Cantharellus anzutake TaxID=1750568 RepID=UPI0019042C62|nr:uncharacterized protein EI90DRAFT_3146238 [Cantharellus anzutake]KAF8328228.1 hypothetical protein EI90DRAFT_3146238 [Cantharellus anzutake]